MQELIQGNTSFDVKKEVISEDYCNFTLYNNL